MWVQVTAFLPITALHCGQDAIRPELQMVHLAMPLIVPMPIAIITGTITAVVA